MNVFDIIGPVMVGPSSSHTAGAVRIGLTARKLLKEPVKNAEVLLYGSFLATGKGHGTDCALIGGLLLMQPDDERIPESFRIAEEQGMHFSFGEANLREGHPNSVVLKLTGVSGKKMEIVGESLGGSLINISEIDGQTADFSGEHPTLIVYNEDQPGLVNRVTGFLASFGVNIAAMQLHRNGRGKKAVMVIECDQDIPSQVIEALDGSPNISGLLYYSPED